MRLFILIWENCVIMIDCKGLGYDHSRNNVIELIYWRYSNWRLDYPTYPCRHFWSQCGQQNKGALMEISKNRSKLDIRKYLLSERVINRWNKLSQENVDQTSLNGFKRVLERRRKVEMATSSWTNCPPSLSGHIYFYRTGVATPGKLGYQVN